MLDVRGVTHAYSDGGRRVLDDVDLSVQPGETVAVVGPSGSGKSTLLAVAGGLLSPERGQVRLQGRRIDTRAGDPRILTRARIAWVFQSTNALPHRTACENVAVGLLPQGRSWSDALDHARARLGQLGLADMTDQLARQLSGGELQRVCVARALAAEPVLLLADEPTGQLDRDTSEAVMDLLLAGGGDTTGILLATHDLALAGRCDRTVELVDGRVA